MSFSVGITVWLLSLFLMLISVSGVSSRVQCDPTGRGSCSPVQVQGCNNAPRGCGTSPELHTTNLQGDRRCREEDSCNMGGPYTYSKATNVSVVILPNSDSLTFDLTVHWDNPNSDDLPRGYEVLLGAGNYIVHCACQRNATIRQVTFKPVYRDDQATYRVEVISLPYLSRSNSATVVRFKLPTPCNGLTYNQYCQGGMTNRNSTWVTAKTFRIMAGGSVPPQNTGQLLLQLTISWVGHFLVALADTDSSSEAISDCYTARKDPPCFIVRDTSSVRIHPLNASRKYRVYVESFTANACGPLGQVHNGYECGRTCRCSNRVQNTTATTVLPVVSTAPTGVTLQQKTRTHTTTLSSTVLEVEGIHPTTTTTGWHAASSVLLPSATDVSSSMGPVGPAVGGALGIVAAVLFFTTTVVTLSRVILWRNRKPPNSTNSKNPALQINNVSFLSSPGPPTPKLPTPSPDPCSEGFNPSPANLELQLSSSLSPCLFTLNPPLPSPPPHPPKPKSSFARSALIIYSPLCPVKDRHTLMQYLINDLMDYDIHPVAHDCDYTKGSLSQWLETEVKRASAVLCVCDPAFQQEWDQQQPADSNFPLVYSLKLLIYANVNRGEELSKYAIVLLRKRDRNCIPTDYLHNTRKFYVNEVKNIAQFVHQVPPYAFH